MLPVKCMAGGSIGKSMGKDFFYPVLNGGRKRVPVERKLEQDDSGLLYIFLLFGGIKILAKKVHTAEDSGNARFTYFLQYSPVTVLSDAEEWTGELRKR